MSFRKTQPDGAQDRSCGYHVAHIADAENQNAAGVLVRPRSEWFEKQPPQYLDHHRHGSVQGGNRTKLAALPPVSSVRTGHAPSQSFCLPAVGTISCTPGANATLLRPLSWGRQRQG